MAANSLLQTYFFELDVEGLAGGGRRYLTVDDELMNLPQGFVITDVYWGLSDAVIDPGGALTVNVEIGIDLISVQSLLTPLAIPFAPSPPVRGEPGSTIEENGLGYPNPSQQGVNLVVSNVGTGPMTSASGTLRFYLFVQGRLVH